MHTRDEALKILANAEILITPERLAATIEAMAASITAELSGSFPLVLSVMGGAAVFTGHLLPLLRFPLNFETINVSRYGKNTGGGALTWYLRPREALAGRTILVLDDIFDEGQTMAAIRQMLVEEGAAKVYCAVLTDKAIAKPKPFVPEFIGLTLPDRYVFGFGMDVRGLWRNLPAIYALIE